VKAPCFVYTRSALINDYLNSASSWSALSVPSAVKNYTIDSGAVYERFVATTDQSVATVSSVQFLLQNQIDVLIYSGNLDLACNTAGSKRWMNAMPWKGQAAFASKGLSPWTSVVGGKEVKTGEFKEVNIKMGADSRTTRFALVTIDGSGHMVSTSTVL
jgi:Carboxypeptidase C (cathepsin A)